MRPCQRNITQNDSTTIKCEIIGQKFHNFHATQPSMNNSAATDMIRKIFDDRCSSTGFISYCNLAEMEAEESDSSMDPACTAQDEA